VVVENTLRRRRILWNDTRAALHFSEHLQEKRHPSKKRKTLAASEPFGKGKGLEGSAAMKKPIIAFVKELKANKKLNSFDEASTKQAVVLRLLSFLEWDIFDVDQVSPDYANKDYRAAYALRAAKNRGLLIDVKRPEEKLDSHQKAFLSFAHQRKFDLAVLTNGVLWWFYLVSAGGGWQQKRFYAVDLLQHPADRFVPHLIELLAKTRVASGESLQTAQSMHQNQKRKIAAEVIPEAWNQMIGQPNNIFVEILGETTERICGYKPDSGMIHQFLKEHREKLLLKNIPDARKTAEKLLETFFEDEKETPPKPPRPEFSAPGRKSYAEASIKSFDFNGQTQAVRSWEEMLIWFCDYFASNYPTNFEKVLWISDEQKPRFSRYSDQLRIPEKIKRTNIYVETKMNPDEILRTTEDLLLEFGCRREDLTISTR
jgi:predicted type IV restriction endonuclease